MITIPRTLLEQALEALDVSRRFVYQDSRPQVDAAFDALNAELAKPVETSCTAMQLAAMVLSDCGISTDHTALHERVAKRITRHEDEMIDRLKKLEKPVEYVEPLEPVACMVETKSGIMLWPIADYNEAVTYCDDDDVPVFLYLRQPRNDRCWCDEQGIGKPGVSCGDCPTRDYKYDEELAKPVQHTPAWHDAPEVAALKAERDELLAALKKLRLAREQNKYPSWEIGIPMFNEAEALADSAIAKAEGGAA